MNYTRKRRWLIAAVFFAAFALRLGYVFELRANSPFFDYPLCDSSTYHESALEILGERPPGEFSATSFYQPPLYPYFLAATYRIFSASFLAPLLIQALLGALSCVLVLLLAEKYFNPKVAIGAGFTAALYRNLIFFDGELLTASLGIFFGLLGLYLAGLALSTGEMKYRRRLFFFAGSGLAFGLLSITIANALLFAVFLFVYIVMRGGIEKKALAAVVFAIPFIVPTSIVTARNYAVSGDTVLVSHNGGLNFYIGNNPDSEETTGIRPGPEWYKLTHLPLIETGRYSMTGPERSKWYFKKAFAYIFSNPGHYLLSQGRKAVRFFNRVEIPRNADFYYLASFSSILSWNFITFQLVSPLALLGMWLSRKRWKELALLYSFIIIYFLSVIAFFVTGRYRLPVVPIMIIFASSAVYEMVSMRKESKKLSVYVAVLAALFLFVSIDWFGDYTPPGQNSENMVLEGKAYNWKGKPEKALAFFDRAISLDPDDAQALFNAGLAFRNLKEPGAAAAMFEAACEKTPGYFEPRYALGLLLSEHGRYDEARKYYESALKIEFRGMNSEYGLLIKLGENEMRAGRPQSAETFFARAAGVFSLRPDAYVGLGAANGALGNLDRSNDFFEKALGLAPRSAAAFNGLIYNHLENGDFASASEIAGRAEKAGVKIDPALLGRIEKEQPSK